MVAADPEARREAMVADWWQLLAGRGRPDGREAKRRGERAERAGAGGDAGRRSARGVEIEVGEAASRSAIRSSPASTTTAQIYNRERWTGRGGRRGVRAVVLDGIDTRRRVCVDSVYLGRVNPSDGRRPSNTPTPRPPTRRRGRRWIAYVMADPSMDRRSSTSRHRGVAGRPGSTRPPRSSSSARSSLRARLPARGP